MPRVKGGVRGARKRKRILKMAEGYQGSRRALIATARRAVERALRYAYRDRKVRKREFRQLWITRINAAARAHDITYSRFMEIASQTNRVTAFPVRHEGWEPPQDAGSVDARPGHVCHLMPK